MVAAFAWGVLGPGDGDGDMDPLLRLRRRADNASSGPVDFGGSFIVGLLQGLVCVNYRGKMICVYFEGSSEMLDFLRAFRRSSRCWS